VDYNDNQEEIEDDEEYYKEQQAEDNKNDEIEQELEPIDPPGEVEDIILDAREDHNTTKPEQPEEDNQE
jgi:hypothetical protein